MSYTQANEGPSWMDRLPRIQSRAKTQTSDNRDDSSIDEKERRAEPSDFPAGFPILRRVREDDRKGSSSRNSSRAPSRHRSRHSKNWEHGPGGPISQGAIGRDPRELNKPQSISRSDSETLANKDESPDTKKADEDDTPPESQPQSPGEIYEEGGETVYEDEEGNVLAVERTNEHGHEREEDEAKEGRRLMHEDGADHNHGVDPTQDDPNTDTGHELAKKASHVEEEAEEAIGSGGKSKRHGLSRLTSLAGMRKSGEAENKAKSKPKEEKKTSNGPARAYQYGNTIIVEDEDGEVIKKYDIPAPDRGNGASSDVSKHRIGRMSKMFGLGGATEENEQVEPGAPGQTKAEQKPKRPEARRMFSSKQPQAANNNEDNDGVRFTVASGGRRMSAAQFISYIGSVDPRTRVQLVEDSTAPEPVKEEARKEAREQAAVQKHSTAESNVPVIPEDASIDAEDAEHKVRTNKDDDLELVDSNEGEIPFHDISAELKKRSAQSGESAAERRRRLALQRQDQDDSDDDGTERQPPRRNNPAPRVDNDSNDNTETAAERRRRLGALGQQEQEPEHNVQRQSTLRWGKDKRSG